MLREHKRTIDTETDHELNRPFEALDLQIEITNLGHI